MKTILTQMLLGLAIILPLKALEPRVFYSADKSKSFTAQLSGYNEESGTVTVTTKSGRTKSFPLKVLSDDCKKYVESKKEVLLISKAITFQITEMKDDKKGKGIPTYFEISVRNNGKRDIEDVKLKYTIHYRQGSLTKATTDDMTHEGTLSTGKIYEKDSMPVYTEKIDIVRDSRKASGGG